MHGHLRLSQRQKSQLLSRSAACPVAWEALRLLRQQLMLDPRSGHPQLVGSELAYLGHCSWHALLEACIWP